MHRNDRPLAIGCGILLLIVGLVPWGMTFGGKSVPGVALALPSLAIVGGLVLLWRAHSRDIVSQDGPSGGASVEAYPDLGANAGHCAVCERTVYAIPGPALMRLVMSNEEDKVRANAMWCLMCDTLHCMGCASDSKQQCSKCGGELGDMHHRRARPPA